MFFIILGMSLLISAMLIGNKDNPVVAWDGYSWASFGLVFVILFGCWWGVWTVGLKLVNHVLGIS